MMRLRAIFEEDDGVTPVVGIALLIVIAVILAAVVATFALGLGGVDEEQPTASFSVETDVPDSLDITVTHETGDSIEAQELFIRGENLTSDSTGAWHDVSEVTPGPEYGPQSEISSTDLLEITAEDTDWEVNVVWQSLETDNSATLTTAEGPDR